MSNQKIEILIAAHKKAIMPNNDIYLPIHVGRYGKADIGYLGDHTGNHISDKNDNYCELTGLYWYLKNRNDNVDFIGLNHYRRYFLPDIAEFKNSAIVRMNIEKFMEIDKKSEEYFLDILKKYDVILPRKRVYPISIKAQYATMHIKEHLVDTFEIISRKYPEYSEIAKKYLNQNKSWLYNMFILNKEQYIKMMNFIFNVLFELENRIKIPDDKQQARVFGFLSERLINIYILKNNLKVKELPVAFIGDGPTEIEQYEKKSVKSDKIFKYGNRMWNYIFFEKNFKVKKSKSKK
ncbi:DUF4422 domain-containing protein [uncultured Clostridium sp.]|uniref:DUF4422 domain-containing protein n=1 Tax=uncultured Clostridium sp. TaxID=59620 RepID=UPI00261ACDE9|nr:DUF4422 domain-containing protein [uncultured Clostridium sp.]